MIICIMGTSGSGKSTIVHELLEKYPSAPVKSKGKTIAHKIDFPGKPVYAIGRYETQCGGCDGIPTQDEVCRRVKYYAKKGHVIFEGLLVSSCFGRYATLLPKLGQHKILFLSTPLRTCISRVKKRRKQRGNTKPFNPTNTEAKFFQMKKARIRAREQFPDLTWGELNYKRATEDVEWALLYAEQD